MRKNVVFLSSLHDKAKMKVIKLKRIFFIFISKQKENSVSFRIYAKRDCIQRVNTIYQGRTKWKNCEMAIYCTLNVIWMSH